MNEKPKHFVTLITIVHLEPISPQVFAYLAAGIPGTNKTTIQTYDNAGGVEINSKPS